MKSRTSIFLYWAAIAAICLAWFAGPLAWYFALPMIASSLWRMRSSTSQASESPYGGELPATFKFTYIDRDGAGSQRTVDVTNISQKDGATYLEGFCHTRGSDRTFRTDRILGNLTNLGTGEVIDAEDLLLSVRERSAMTFMPGVKSDGAKWQTAVLFAGFSESEQEELEELASDAGWDVRSAVSPSLDYLVAGPSISRKLLASAAASGIKVVDQDEFRALV